MLRIYSDVLDWLELIAPLIRQIARHDSNLATQLRRACTSVALNLGEGAYGRGRRRVAAYGISAQEMGESLTALDVAERLRYIEPIAPPLRESIWPWGGAACGKLGHADDGRSGLA